MRLWPFDAETKTVDFGHLRATDLPFNKRAHLPIPIDEQEEIAMQVLKHKLLKTTKEYVKHAGSKSNGRENLTNEEKKGLESLKKRRDRDGVVVYHTD